MKKRMCFFDTVCTVALICLLFTIGFHIGKEKEKQVPGHVLINVSVERFKDERNLNNVMIDGKYECQIVSFDGKSLKLICRGEYTEAGFLASGAKYLSKNQPIEIVGDSYFFGRITSIDKTAKDTVCIITLRSSVL